MITELLKAIRRRLRRGGVEDVEVPFPLHLAFLWRVPAWYNPDIPVNTFIVFTENGSEVHDVHTKEVEYEEIT